MGQDKMIEPENSPNWLREYFIWLRNYQFLLNQIASGQAMEQKPENTEPDNENLVPISDAEAYRAMDAVSRIETIADMGIYPPTRWKVIGRCSYHGFQYITVETVNKLPDDRAIYCQSCLEANVHRRVPVLEIAPSTE